jgi:hypothetical protein
MIYSMIQTGVSASSVGSVEIDMRDDDKIVAVQMLIWGTFNGLVPTNTPVESQLSFLSTPDFQTNDLNGLLVQTVAAPIAADPITPVTQFHFAGQIMLPDVAVQGGERIYLHTTGPNNVQVRIKATIFTAKAGRTVARRLR